jgi:hypothetical protein
MMGIMITDTPCSPQPATLWLPVLSLIIAALAVFVGPFITLRIGRKQIELSRRIASKQIVAPMRQAWINELRNKVAELSGSALHYWNTGFDDRKDEEVKRIWQLEEEIKLMINPIEEDHKKLVETVRQLLWAMQRGVAMNAAEDFSTARITMTAISQKIFKQEWNRIKDDIENP